MSDPARPDDRPPQPASPPAPEPAAYDLIAEDPKPAGTPAPALKVPSLLKDFDEDADFERDPDVERAKSGKPTRSTPTLLAPGEEPIVKPGLGDEKVMAIAGAVLLIGAVIAVFIRDPGNTPARALLVAFQCVLHAGTGLAALAAAAAMLGKPLGHPDLGAARMFVAVGIFQIIANINVLFPGTRADELALGAAAYFGAVWLLFRRPPDQTAIIAGFHFLGWLAVFLTGQLYAWANRPIPTPAG